MKRIALLIVVILLACCTPSATPTPYKTWTPWPTLTVPEGPSEDPSDCIEFEWFKCDSFAPRGTVVNNCSQDIWMLQLVVSGYASKGGEKLDADDEYVEDLKAGKKKDFEALFDPDYEERIKYCSVRIEDVIFE